MAAKTMHAVQYDRYGGGAAGLKHAEVPIPRAKKDEILLKVEAAAINQIDWKIQNGKVRPFMPPHFPFIPVVDVAGEVAEVGSGVERFKPGDKVISMLNFKTAGGLAVYAVAPAGFTVYRPPDLPPDVAASLPTAACTAIQSLKAAGATFAGTSTATPTNILITGASGSVGLLAVQLAKLAGLHVTTTCGARNLDLVKSMGADEVLDYKTPAGTSLRSPSGQKYDAVVHCAATSGINWAALEPNLSSNATVVDVSPGLKTMIASFLKKVSFSKKKVVAFLVDPKVDELEFAVELLKQGKLRVVVDSKHPLRKAEEAWEKSMGGHATGKIIVEM